MSKLDPRVTTSLNLPEDVRASLAALHLHDRISWAAENLERVETDKVVVIETDPESQAGLLVPAPEWMACALFGGLLPPVEVYHALEFDDGSPVLNRSFHGVDPSQDGLTVRNGHLLHLTPPIAPMSEDEAIEYLVLKDAPREVWDADKRSNSARFAICSRDQIPPERTFRNAWRMADNV